MSNFQDKKHEILTNLITTTGGPLGYGRFRDEASKALDQLYLEELLKRAGFVTEDGEFMTADEVESLRNYVPIEAIKELLS